MYSKEVWKKVSPIIDAIMEHPFNQELAFGTLSEDKFAFYIEQDSRFLQDFAMSHAIIATKISAEFILPFLQFASNTIKEEQEIVHEYFRKIYNFTSTGKITPATLSYTSYLLRVCSLEPVEVGVAAVLPCFWVYREVGLAIAKNSASNNPYSRWIETYASDGFSKTVSEVIRIFDALAAKTTPEIRERMYEAFYNTTVLEWHFWNDAYYQNVFDEIALNTITTS